MTGAAGTAAPLPSLSTMWAVQPRFERDLIAFMARAIELGFRGVEINHSMDAAQVGVILGARSLTVTAVHAPAPLEQVGGRWNRDLNLASTDEQERTLAVEQHLRSVDLAAEAGAPLVVVHLGSAGARALAGERRLRSMYDRREQLPEEWERTVDETVRERARIVAPHLEPARRSLEAIAARARSRGVTVGLECRLLYHEIPSPQEAASFIDEYPREVAGYLHDVGHAEVQHRLGLTDRSTWFDLLGDRLVGMHLHDVRGLTDHRAPGNGSVDYDWLSVRLNPTAARTFEIDQHEPDEDVARGLELLREAGVIA